MFKVGDRIRCVNDSRRTDSIQEGSIYTIVGIMSRRFFYLKEVDDDIFYFADIRFEALKKCKATRLAKKLYPDAVEENGWLYV